VGEPRHDLGDRPSGEELAHPVPRRLQVGRRERPPPGIATGGIDEGHLVASDRRLLRVAVHDLPVETERL
jgi:hypothetical protein